MNLLDLFVKISVDDQASAKIEGIGSSIKSSLGNAAKAASGAVAAGVAAAGAGVTALGKAALDGYAQYEQLEGGIDKLFGTGGKSLEEYAAGVGQSVEEAAGKFDALNQAHDLVMENAQKAYSTAGMSANQYMENVSGFSAALTNALGGDTVKAAEQADVAMRAISDNVNTFGSNIDSVSYAFQGFARGSYAMLDNLKLGYGGNAEEMQRLIDDANEWGAANGRASDLSIDSFSDVVTAIQQIQEKQQIAGTTAREASKTIEGSLNATKAAWSNLLTELGKEDGDIGARIGELAESAGNVVDNVIPRIAKIGDGLAQALPQILPKAMELGGQIISSVAQGIASTLPGLGQAVLQGAAGLVTSLAEAFNTGVKALVGGEGGEGGAGLLEAGQAIVTQLGGALAQAAPLVMEGLWLLVQYIGQTLSELLPQALEALMGLVGTIGTTLMENGPYLLEQAGVFFGNILNALITNLPMIIQGIIDMVFSMVDTLIQNGPQMLVAAGEFILSILTAIVQNLPQILAALASGIMQLVGGVIERVPDMLAAGVQLIGGLLEAVGNAAGDMVSSIGELIGKGIDAVGGFVGDMISAGADLVQGLIDGIWSNISGVGDTIMQGLGGAVESAKSFLGIASPSKLFKEFGEFTMEGFAIGIDADAAKAEQAMRNAAAAVYGAASGTVDMGLSAGAAASQPPVNVVIENFVNNTREDARSLAQRIGEYTDLEMKMRGYRTRTSGGVA